MDDNRTTTDGLPPRPGYENAGAPAPTKPNGQHEAYWILTAEERSKGFIRPVRTAYKHVGLAAPKYPLRDLTPHELESQGKWGYVKFEEYPESEFPLTGKYWTQPDLDKINSGCGCVTSMARSIAETYARNPSFYGATFCYHCGKHLPVAEFVWDHTDERVGS